MSNEVARLMRGAAALAGVVFAALALASCSKSSSGGGGSPATSAGSVTTPAAPSTHAAPVTTSVSQSSAPPAGSGSGSFVMPNEVGKILQTAQDDIQRVSGNPIFFSHSTDATGQGRHQILDRDWKVCKQNIPAGQKVNEDSYISFAAVKTYENCP